MRILFLGDVVGISGCSKIMNNLLNQINTTLVGGVLPTLSQKQIANYLIPIPKLDNEQLVIAVISSLSSL